MKIFNKISGNFIKRGIILITVLVGIHVVYVAGGNIIEYNNSSNSNNYTRYDNNTIIGDGKRIWPIKNKKVRITSHYGPRVNPVTKRQSFHSGIDLGINEGENLYAVSSGIITFSGFKGAYRIHNSS